jgi:predicted tellurium resistance membrane protein TerC
MLAELFTAENMVALLTLTALEIVLGIDNVIFIAILAAKLPLEQQAKARTIGISLAVVTRILLLLSVTWIMQLTEPLFTIFGHSFSGRDLILIGGGLFLIWKSVHELHEKLEADEHVAGVTKQAVSFSGVIIQIVLMDIIFSLDSVLTAIGISGDLIVMIPAVIIAAGVMLFFAGPISRFVEAHPTFKILALAFLIMIGIVLVFEGLNPELAHQIHLKNYVYFAMAFAVVIEVLNMRFRKSHDPLELHNRPHLSQATLPDTNIEMASDVY